MKTDVIALSSAHLTIHGMPVILLEQFSVPYKDSDILIGYRANDSYFAFANDFLNGTISLRQFEEAMYLGKLVEQVVLKSEESCRHIRFLEYEPVDAAVWYPRRKKPGSKRKTAVFSAGSGRLAEGSAVYAEDFR